MKKILFFGFVVLFVGIVQAFSLYDWWRPYSPAKIMKDPRPFMIKAEHLCESLNFKDKLAFDMGAGSGHDTAYLLKKGWRVWANDDEKESIDFMRNRPDIAEYRKNLTLLQTSFIDIPWNTLPRFDLIYAAFSLPFMRRGSFDKVWPKIVDNLSTGKVFAGTFFGKEHAVFGWWVNWRMTFLTKEECLNLFKDFTIQYFDEYRSEYEDGFNHMFNVIAVKK